MSEKKIDNNVVAVGILFVVLASLISGYVIGIDTNNNNLADCQAELGEEVYCVSYFSVDENGNDLKQTFCSDEMVFCDNCNKDYLFSYANRDKEETIMVYKKSLFDYSYDEIREWHVFSGFYVDEPCAGEEPLQGVLE